MSVEKIIDHTDRTKARIISRWKKDPVVLLQAENVGEQSQELEDLLHEFYSFLSIDSMIGAQLDTIGVILGQKRNGLTDIEYRVYLKAKIGQNVGSGTLSDIRIVWNLLLPNHEVQIVEQYPCSISIQTDAELTEEEWKLIKRFAVILCAGVKLNNIIFFEETPFSFQEDPDNPDTAGFGDYNDADAGGDLSTIIM